jgi:hypothetical protein
MNNILKKWLLLTFVAGVLMIGCSRKNEESREVDYYDNSDNIQIDVSSEVLSFDVVLLTKDKLSDVRFVACSGKNLDASNINVSILNNSLDSYSDSKTEGLYCSDWLIDMEFAEEGDYEIDSLTLNVNGTEKVLEFKYPLKYKKEGGNDVINGQFYNTFVQSELPSSIIGTDETVQYEFETGVDCTFKGLNIKDFFDLSDAIYYVNGEKQELPISLKKGDKVYVQMNYKEHNDDINQYTYLLTNIEAVYELDGNEIVRSNAIVFDPISPMDEENEKLDLFVNNALGN